MQSKIVFFWLVLCDVKFMTCNLLVEFFPFDMMATTTNLDKLDTTKLLLLLDVQELYKTTESLH